MDDSDGIIVCIAIVIVILGAGAIIGFNISSDYHEAQVIICVDYIDMLEKYDTINLQSENVTLTRNEIITFGKISNIRMESTP